MQLDRQLARLGRRYAAQVTHEMNGDPHPRSRTDDKNFNAALWARDAEKTATRMTAVVKEMGFHHLDFGVGLYPTIQRTESDTDGTIHFDYSI